MKKASDILLLIGSILSFSLIAVYLISSIVFFVLGSPAAKQFILDGINNGSIGSSIPADSPEQLVTILQAMFIASGVVMFIPMAFAIVSGIVALKARRNATRGLYIANIVFGIISGSEINLVGAILGLIASRHNPE